LFGYFEEEINLLQISQPIAILCADCAVPHELEDGIKTSINKMRQECPI
jgi:hypothetical protein